MGSRSEGRAVRDEADARSCRAAMAASGKTLGGWAREDGVLSHSFERGPGKERPGRSVGEDEARRLSATASLATGLRLAELTAPTRGTAPEPVRHELLVGRYSVVLGGDFDDAALARILRLAVAC